MQTVAPQNPPAFQNDPVSGTSPGATQGPADGQDSVQASTVIAAMQDLTNTVAYLAALLLGPSNAPPNAQPPALATTGLGSGPSRKQTLHSGPVSLASLPTLNATPLQVVNIPGVGEYVYISPYLAPAWANNTSYTTGQFVTNNGAIYQCTTGGTSALIGSGSGPNGPGWGITDGTNGLLWASITFAGGDGTDCVQSATPSDWTATKAYIAGQYVLDPAHTSNIWLCITPGTSGSGSGSPATPFTNATPTTGVSTQADGSGALVWASVAFVGQWISLNALRKGFPANVLANVGTKTSEESFQPQLQGLVQTDQGGTIPLPYLPLTAAVWIGPGQPYYVGDRVCVPSSGGGGYLLVCIAPGYSGSSPPIGSQGTVVGEGSGTPTWIVIGHSLYDDFPFAKQLAYTEGGTTATPGTIPPSQTRTRAWGIVAGRTDVIGQPSVLNSFGFDAFIPQSGHYESQLTLVASPLSPHAWAAGTYAQGQYVVAPDGRLWFMLTDGGGSSAQSPSGPGPLFTDTDTGVVWRLSAAQPGITWSANAFVRANVHGITPTADLVAFVVVNEVEAGFVELLLYQSDGTTPVYPIDLTGGTQLDVEIIDN